MCSKYDDIYYWTPADYKQSMAKPVVEAPKPVQAPTTSARAYWAHDDYGCRVLVQPKPELTEVIAAPPKVQQRGPRGSGSLWQLQQVCMNRTKYLVCGKCTSTCQCK